MENETLYENIPAPQAAEETEENTTFDEITADDIQEQILATSEEGYCPCTIIVSLENLHGVKENDTLDNIKEEQRELIEDMIVDYCKVDMYSLDQSLYNLIFEFETPKDAYLKELCELLDKYRDLQEAKADSDDPELPVPMLTVTFAPDKFEGTAMANFIFPIGYFKTLGDENEETCLHMLFRTENAQYERIEIDPEMKAELQAEVLREIEAKQDLE